MFNTTKELAQAIREAIEDPNITPVHGPYISRMWGGVYGACVCGSTVIKAGFDPNALWDSGDLERDIPALAMHVASPITGNELMMSDALISLWESQHWAWEQIADWLEEVSNGA